jgi:hypothetical protein
MVEEDGLHGMFQGSNTIVLPSAHHRPLDGSFSQQRFPGGVLIAQKSQDGVAFINTASICYQKWDQARRIELQILEGGELKKNKKRTKPPTSGLLRFSWFFPPAGMCWYLRSSSCRSHSTFLKKGEVTL